jgi:response regulator RpfG family c-di-GMP phosphodiesterase
MDCQMPEMDGYEATAAIRKGENGGSKRMPVIAMTAHAIDGEREKCLAAGMDDYISKPVQKESLRRIVEQWIKVSQEAAKKPTEANSSGADNPPAEDKNIIDFELLRELTLGDPVMFGEIIQLYLEQTREQLREMDEAITRLDADKLYQVAHKALGGSATCGLATIVPIFRQLEIMGKTRELAGAADFLAAARSTFAEISRQCHAVTEELISR